MEGIIYKYVSPSGKVYIGQTINEEKRKHDFLHKKVYAGYKIDKARKKYGPENFEYSVLVKVCGDNEEELVKYLDILEIGFIKMYNSNNTGYNSTNGGHSTIGYVFTDEHKQKIKDSRVGMIFSKEHCRNISVSMTGKSLSEETKRKISESHKGRLSHPITQEMRQKISESMMGRRDSEETKRKKSESAKAGWEKRRAHK